MFRYLFVDMSAYEETELETGVSKSIKKRGGTCSKGARRMVKACKTKLPVVFNFQMRKVVSDNESQFMFECGYILRNNCTFAYKEWRYVPNEVRMSLRDKLTVSFLL